MKHSRETAIRVTIISTCVNGPVDFGTIQRACNFVAERMFGDISNRGTTIPVFPIVAQLVGEQVLRMDVDSEEKATYSLAAETLT